MPVQKENILTDDSISGQNINKDRITKSHKKQSLYQKLSLY